MLAGDPPAPGGPIAMVPVGEAAERRALRLAHELRRAGLVIELGYRGNLKRRMQRANKVNARAAVILGDDELARGCRRRCAISTAGSRPNSRSTVSAKVCDAVQLAGAMARLRPSRRSVPTTGRRRSICASACSSAETGPAGVLRRAARCRHRRGAAAVDLRPGRDRMPWSTTIRPSPRSRCCATACSAAARPGSMPVAGERVYVHVGRRGGLRHLFAVACSLDSLIVGEPQVLGQVKESHRRAAKLRHDRRRTWTAACRPPMRAAKRVRSETAIGERPVSIASAAVEVARDVHGDSRARRGPDARRRRDGRADRRA